MRHHISRDVTSPRAQHKKATTSPQQFSCRTSIVRHTICLSRSVQTQHLPLSDSGLLTRLQKNLPFVLDQPRAKTSSDVVSQLNDSRHHWIDCFSFDRRSILKPELLSTTIRLYIAWWRGNFLTHINWIRVRRGMWHVWLAYRVNGDRHHVTRWIKSQIWYCTDTLNSTHTGHILHLEYGSTNEQHGWRCFPTNTFR